MVRLAGAAIRLAPDVPVCFDGPLSLAERTIARCLPFPPSGPITHAAAAAWITQSFNQLVQDILAPVTIVDLSATVVSRQFESEPSAGDESSDTDIGILLNVVDYGELPLGWIEQDAAPIEWRRHAYRAICSQLPRILPSLDFESFFEEFSVYYWGGETTDSGAIESLEEHHEDDGAFDPSRFTLPSQLRAKQLDWMLPASEKPLSAARSLPRELRYALARLAAAARSYSQNDDGEASPWSCDGNNLIEFAPEYESVAHLPPLTIFPSEPFQREVDAIFQIGMELGFMDVCGLAIVRTADDLRQYLAALKRGVDVLVAIQNIIALKPEQLGHASHQN